MKKTPISCILSFIILFFLCINSASAYTAEQIINTFLAEMDNIEDYSASVDCEVDLTGFDDMTDGSIQWKRPDDPADMKMFKMDQGNFNTTVVSDGTAWNTILDTDNGSYTFTNTIAEYKAVLQDNGFDMFFMEDILNTETWTVSATTENVNNESCYKLYTSKNDSNYEVWVDSDSRTKIMRVKSTDDNDDLIFQLDYSGYSDVENTAQLPATITVKKYVDSLLYCTYVSSFSDIDINESLSDSIFELE